MDERGRVCVWGRGGLRETDVTPANESRANRARAQGDPVGLVLRHRAFTCRVSVKTFRGKSFSLINCRGKRGVCERLTTCHAAKVVLRRILRLWSTSPSPNHCF